MSAISSFGADVAENAAENTAARDRDRAVVCPIPFQAEPAFRDPQVGLVGEFGRRRLLPG
ncbi:hypothetical protein [Mesorhizobium sp. BHbdii]